MGGRQGHGGDGGDGGDRTSLATGRRRRVGDDDDDGDEDGDGDGDEQRKTERRIQSAFNGSTPPGLHKYTVDTAASGPGIGRRATAAAGACRRVGGGGGGGGGGADVPVWLDGRASGPVEAIQRRPVRGGTPDTTARVTPR